MPFKPLKVRHLIYYLKHPNLIKNTGTTWSVVDSVVVGQSWITTLVSKNNTIFAGMFSDGVFISTDGGTNWRAVNTGLTKSLIGSLAVIGDTLFAGTIGRGVWRRQISEISAVTRSVSISQSPYSPFTVAIPTRSNPHITIGFVLQTKESMTITLYTLSGRQIATLVNRNFSPGSYTIGYPAHGMTHGLYTLRMQIGTTAVVKRISVL
jgi:hypothetical protein